MDVSQIARINFTSDNYTWPKENGGNFENRLKFLLGMMLTVGLFLIHASFHTLPVLHALICGPNFSLFGLSAVIVVLTKETGFRLVIIELRPPCCPPLPVPLPPRYLRPPVPRPPCYTPLPVPLPPCYPHPPITPPSCFPPPLVPRPPCYARPPVTRPFLFPVIPVSLPFLTRPPRLTNCGQS